MSFGLGVLAGYGSAQREVNVRTHEEGLAAEKEKNEHTATILHDFMLRPDITPEMGQAALGSLMEFSSTPGIPGAKERSKAFEGLTGAMAQQRQFVSPDVQAKRAQGQADQSAGAGMTATAAGPAGGGGMTSVPAIPAFGAPGVAMSTRGAAESATPMPGGDTRRGLLSKEEQAVIAGHAMGAQTQAMYGSMGNLPGFGGGSAGPGTGDGTHIMYVPNGKGGVSPHFINDTEQLQQTQYVDSNGDTQIGATNFNRRTGTSTDGRGRPVTVLKKLGPDGWMTMTGVGPDNTPTKTEELKSNAAGAGSTPQYVPNKFINVRGADNTVSTVPVSPATGRVTGPAAATGVVQTDTQLAAQNARTASTEVNTDLKQRMYKANYDPTYRPDLPTPAGQILLNIDNKPTLVGMKQYLASKEPASAIQRASTAHVALPLIDDAISMIEDPKNAEFYGKIAGRWSELQTEGPTAFGKKVFGPIGSNDPRLSALHAAGKSISALLMTVHGSRAIGLIEDYERSMSMANSPSAAAAVLRQYRKVAVGAAAEAGRTTVPVTGASGVATPASGAGSAAATHVYIPGRGAVPITSTVPAGPP